MRFFIAIHTSKGCIYPGAPTNGHISPSNAMYGVGATVTFSCNTGYSLVGVSSQKCLSTNLFSDKVPSCISENDYGESITSILLFAKVQSNYMLKQLDFCV